MVMTEPQRYLEDFGGGFKHGTKRTSIRWHCPNCGLNLGKERDVCPYCGEDIRLRIKECSYVYHCSCCGRIVSVDAIACQGKNCGADLR